MHFCPICYKRMAEKWAKKCNYDPRFKLDVKKMIFPCQVPIYEPSNTGETMVRVWDCANNVSRVYPLKDWQLKQKNERAKQK